MEGIFQTPTTFNNLGNNYEFSEASGVSEVTFTGITSANGTRIISDSDVNQNQLPRGGVIVSLGSTGGLGVANLAPAKVKATTNGSGAIVGIVGLSTTGSSFGISTASFNNTTGELQVTTSTNHDFRNINEFVRLDGLVFNPTLTIPNDTSFSVTGILSSLEPKKQSIEVKNTPPLSSIKKVCANGSCQPTVLVESLVDVLVIVLFSVVLCLTI